MRFYIVLLSFCLLLACNKNTEQAMINTADKNSGDGLTYLALGDSYTIGESVAQKESFPYQLVSELKAQKITVANPKIIAKTGWTTDELEAAIKAENIVQGYDIVTLLIGVNNQYRGYPTTTYRKEFKSLLQTAINFAGKNKKHVFVVSIPDWGVTPFGKGSGRDPKAIATEIDTFNAINKEETLAAGVSYTDITVDSRNAATDISLIANDGLHPSGKMYNEWAIKVGQAITTAFK